MKNPIQQAEAYFTEAKKEEEKGRYKEAILLLQKAAEIYQKQEDVLQYIEKQVAISDMYGHAHKFEEMYVLLQVILKQTLDLSTSKQQQGLLAGIYNNFGIYYHQHIGDFHEAQMYYEKALGIQKINFDAQDLSLATSYSNIAFCQGYKGDYQDSFDYFKKALEIYLFHYGKTSLEVGNSYNNLGWSLTQCGDYVQAEVYFKKALQIYTQIYDEPNESMALSYNNIAFCLLQNQNYEEALNYYKKSLEIRLRTENEAHNMIAPLYRNIGITHTKLGNYEEATVSHRKALKIYLQLFDENHLSVSLPYMALGYNLFVQQKLEEAISVFEKALKIRQGSLEQKHPLLGENYMAIARCLQEQKHFAAALQQYQNALISLCDHFEVKDTYINPSNLQDNKSAIFLSKTLYNKAQTFYQLYTEESKEITDLNAAYQTYYTAIHFIDYLRQNYQAEGSKLILSRENLPIYEGAIEVAFALYQQTDELAYLYQAFDFSEKSKALILLSNLTEADAKIAAHIPGELLQRENKLKSDISNLDKKIRQEKLKYTEANETLVREWQGQYFDLDQAYQQLIAHFEVTYPEYHQLKYEIQTPKIEDIQQQMSVATAMIEYFMGERNIYIFVLTKTNMRLVKVDKPKDFEKSISHFQRAIDTGSITRFVAASSQMYSYLIYPIEAQLVAQKRLIIIADDQLHRLSFETLINPMGVDETTYSKLPYLIADYQIIYQYSAALWLHTYHKHQKTAQQKDSFFGIAPVSFGTTQRPTKGYIIKSGQINTEKYRRNVVLKSANSEHEVLVDLEATEAEVKDIYTLFCNKQLDATALFYDQASKENLQQYISNTKYVLLSTHGFVNKKMPSLSGLYLYRTPKTALQEIDNGMQQEENDKLYISETYHLHLSADLVVLSSCESGIGDLRKGEGMIALNRGFLYAGASNVIYSLFKIPQDASSEIVRFFFQQVLDNQSDYADALRNAKLKLIAENREMRDWAGFALLGV
ncbi:MAG: CHAT domain-containing tetratricopeptide repeat protein [Chitinophagales bacterium]